MNNLKALYDELGKTYEVEWDNGDSYSFTLYFDGKRGRKYQLHISEDMVHILRKAKIFHWSYWREVSHWHCDDYSFNDVFDVVQHYLDRYQ